jgi:rSAM/selenodomain-associated transferase 1
MKRQVVLVAKAPVPGRSKTRLVPPLSAEQAAGLQRALLLDTLEACRAEVPDTAILHSDPDEEPVLRSLAGGEARLILQEGRGLEAALAGAMARLLPDGPVALVSSDIPGIPAGALGLTFAALDGGADVVLGPALDGGYWLIAMREYHDEPFRGILWSTPAVYATTVRRCAEAGLLVHALEPWRDLDTPVDLDFALAELAGLQAPRTEQMLRELRSAGIAIGEPPRLSLAASELALSSRWRSALSDELASPDGSSTEYTYLAVPRAVFVVPVTDGGELVLVRQYRHPVRDWTLEVPAGSVDDGESTLEAAARELAEEAGGRARNWRHLSTFYSSSAHLSLRSDAFLATGVILEAPEPDEGEEVATVCVPLAEALARARAGGFAEGQTALSILLAAPYLEQGG